VGDPKACTLVIRGVKGFLAGEERRVGIGEAVVIGRSREADVSVRSALRTLDRGDYTDILESDPFKSVSRLHVRIHFLHPGLVEVKDLSQNGTFLDGKRVDCVGLTDLDEHVHILSLGDAERLSLEIV